jgi:hypothetical protein
VSETESLAAPIEAAAVAGKANNRRSARSKRANAIPWRNRIVGHSEVPPADLVANPANWRLHPNEQARALGGALGEVGWVAQVLVNRQTGHLVDGHLRVELALARGERSVPVSYVDLSPQEERLVLASLDPLGAMADADTAKLEELLRDLAPADDALAAMLTELAERNGIVQTGLTDPDEVGPLPEDRPGELARIGEAVGTAGVNITALAGLTGKGAGLIGFLVSDEAGARGALRAAGIEAKEVEAIKIALVDEPGALGKAARKLATAGVNVELILSTGISHGKGALVLAVNDARKARTLLGDLVVEG